MSLIEDLQWRHAVKAYDSTKKVSEEDLNKILEAARLAPTSSGLQPFRVIVVENQELKEQMVKEKVLMKMSFLKKKIIVKLKRVNKVMIQSKLRILHKLKFAIKHLIGFRFINKEGKLWNV